MCIITLTHLSRLIKSFLVNVRTFLSRVSIIGRETLNKELRFGHGTLNRELLWSSHHFRTSCESDHGLCSRGHLPHITKRSLSAPSVICGRWDLNPHVIAHTRSLEVLPTFHPGISSKFKSISNALFFDVFRRFYVSFSYLSPSFVSRRFSVKA